MSDDDEETELGTSVVWLDEEDADADDGDYVEISKGTGWREPAEERTPTGELTPDEIRERIDDPEAAEKIIQALRNSTGTRVRKELGPPPDEADSSEE